LSSSHFVAFIDEFSGAEPADIDPGLVLAVLAELPDPRKKRGVRHRFAHLLVIMVCAVIAGQKTLVEVAEWAADTAREQLVALGIGAPHATTLGRVLERLDADAMDNLIGAWSQAATAATAIAIDGKEVRGAKNGGGARVHLMAAIDQDTGAVLGQVSVAEKSNEIPYFSTLMDTIKDVRGVVVTADALHTQRSHATYLHERGAHYVLTVKGNQPALHTQLASLPWNRVRAGNRTKEQTNGREIARTVKCVSVAAGINFPHAAQAIQITRKSRPLGTRKWSTETVHAVTSLTPSEGQPAQIGAWIRGHWGIENGLHWRRDVLWNEDHSQVRKGQAPRVMASLRNLAITIHRLAGQTNLSKATRAARNHPNRALKLAGINFA
jgi:predicted transposase YbfD/YdcC